MAGAGHVTSLPRPLFVVAYRYITVLVEMTKFEGTQHGKLIASQMLDVSIRVKDVRPFVVRQMVSKTCPVHAVYIKSVHV